MTDQPNFDQRITAAENALISEIWCALMDDAPEWLVHQVTIVEATIRTTCGAVRDYARQPADPINTQGGK